jgi:uncharacterized protein YaiE (UPF0345 family)
MRNRKWNAAESGTSDLRGSWCRIRRDTDHAAAEDFSGGLSRRTMRDRNFCVDNIHPLGNSEESMSKFESVSVVKAANVYFDGNVTSRSVEFTDGSLKTLGIMLPGEYKFNTGKPELMEIQSGELTYCLAGETTWHSIKGGEAFNVPGNSHFLLKVTKVTDYICSFL